MIRMQGAKTSKIMFPCGRRVHLHKSASFKTNLINDAKNNPKMIDTTIKKPSTK